MCIKSAFCALFICTGALDLWKGALQIRNRALQIRKRALQIYKRAPNLRLDRRVYRLTGYKAKNFFFKLEDGHGTSLQRYSMAIIWKHVQVNILAKIMFQSHLQVWMATVCWDVKSFENIFKFQIILKTCSIFQASKRTNQIEEQIKSKRALHLDNTSCRALETRKTNTRKLNPKEP